MLLTVVEVAVEVLEHSEEPKKFAKGGPVRGPSHAQGGVPAILEGGEYVIPKGYAEGRKGIRNYKLIETKPKSAKTIWGIFIAA